MMGSIRRHEMSVLTGWLAQKEVVEADENRVRDYRRSTM
jgi:hypothetical protein